MIEKLEKPDDKIQWWAPRDIDTQEDITEYIVLLMWSRTRETHVYGVCYLRRGRHVWEYAT